MSGSVRPILGVALIFVVWISALILLGFIGSWLINLISPRVLDIGCGGLLLLLLWISVIAKSRIEIRDNGHVNVFRWLGLLFATILFIGFYNFINTLDTKGQVGCGFAMFILVLGIISSTSPPPSVVGDDEDDYHASR